MKYLRLPYMAEGAAFMYKKMIYSPTESKVPVIDTPITPRENFKLAWKHKTPQWIPLSLLDFDSIGLGKTSSMDLSSGKRLEFFDEWGCEWVYVPEVRGSMLKPGTQFLDDITRWESKVHFPDWKTSNFKTAADRFHQNRKNPDSVLSVDIGSCGTERLVAIMGGYEEAMVSMAMEPEAVLSFMNAQADNMIERYDVIHSYYPSVDMVTFHDDWGTERDTFFTPVIMKCNHVD